MKKSFLIAGIILLLTASCSKTPFENGVLENQDANLVVNVYEIEHTPFSSLVTRTAPENACTHINYAVYNLDGTRIKQVNQVLGDANFGTASFKLTEGDYFLAVVAHSSNSNPTMTDPTCIKFTNANGYSDTFLCSGNITIGEESQEMSVSLNRIVALCRFVTTDEIPDDVTRLKFYYTGGSGAFDAQNGLGCVNSKQTVIFDLSDGQTQFDLYTFLHDTEGTIHLTVTALDDDDNVLNERTFDVPLQQNHITWLSGAFFNGSSASTATITGININTDWAGEERITF